MPPPQWMTEWEDSISFVVFGAVRETSRGGRLDRFWRGKTERRKENINITSPRPYTDLEEEIFFLEET